MTKYDTSVTLDQITAATGAVDLNSQRIINLLDPVSDQDAATKKFVSDNTLSNLATLDTIPAPVASVSMSN